MHRRRFIFLRGNDIKAARNRAVGPFGPQSSATPSEQNP
jgi:hypothetical protein